MSTGLEIVVAKAVLGHVAKLAATQALPEDKLRQFLGRDPQRLAMQAALRAAFADFKQQRPTYAAAFFDETFLTSDRVARILAQSLTSAGEPDAVALAAAWQRQLPGRRGQPGGEAVAVARDFLACLRRRLRDREEFRLLHQARDAERTAEATEQILDLVRPVFERILDRRRSLSELVVDFTQHCWQRAGAFVGRGRLIDAIDAALQDPGFPSGYIVVRGEPGVGKTAVAAHLVLTRGYVHHFNIRRREVTSAALFRQNVCAQLILRYGLEDPDLTMPNADPLFLDKVLARVAEVGELPVVIVIDALDEADTVAGVDRLTLPEFLPDGVYIVATTRPLANDGLPLERDERPLTLGPEDAADVSEYVRTMLTGERAADYAARLAEWDLRPDELADLIGDNAEGNFMYAVQVLRDIRSGQLTPATLADPSALPTGLGRYYELHWELMRTTSPARFDRLGRPVVAMLAAAQGPVPAAKVAEWVNADGAGASLAEVDEVLGEWREYLDEVPGDPPLWQLYHESFREFLDKKVSLRAHRRLQADAALAKIPHAPR